MILLMFKLIRQPSVIIISILYGVILIILFQDIDIDVDKILDRCSKHLKMTKTHFCNTLTTLAKILEDSEFLEQMCKINDDIYQLGVDENNNNEGVKNYNLSG